SGAAQPILDALRNRSPRDSIRSAIERLTRTAPTEPPESSPAPTAPALAGSSAPAESAPASGDSTPAKAEPNAPQDPQESARCGPCLAPLCLRPRGRATPDCLHRAAIPPMPPRPTS